MPEAPTIQELIKLTQAAKSGDKRAFSVVYETFYVPVFRYCQKRVRHLGDAEDITQQVFLRLYSSRSGFSDQNISPLNYLFIIARHCLADFWTKQQKTPVQMPEDFDVPEMQSQTDSVLSHIASEQLLQLVNAEEKEILTLRLVDGYSSREVAERINKSEAAVRQIQCRALQKIKKQITV